MVEGYLRFICSTPDCAGAQLVRCSFDADGRGREVSLYGQRPACELCGCRMLPDWDEGPKLDG